MKPMTPKRTRRLRARAATMNSREEEFEDYGPEPNMKLSHAFMVVLLLHVVAVGGLYAFNSIKHDKDKVAAHKNSGGPSNNTVTPPPEPSNDQGSGKSGGPGEEPPITSKSPIVAKASEAPKAAKNSKEIISKEESSHSGGGLLASARNMIRKTVGAAGVAGGAKAVAQEPTDQQVPSAGSSIAAGTAPVSGTPSTYMVKAGDTLTRIASSLGVAIPDLEKVNGMTEKSVIQVGQILKVPVKAAGQAAAEISTQATKVAGSVQQAAAPVASAVGSLTGAVPATNATPSPDTSGAQEATTEYTIQKGDSPYKIAKKFKITPDQLMKANGITDPKKIQIGQKLKIPAATSSKKAAQ